MYQGTFPQVLNSNLLPLRDIRMPLAEATVSVCLTGSPTGLYTYTHIHANLSQWLTFHQQEKQRNLGTAKSQHGPGQFSSDATNQPGKESGKECWAHLLKPPTLLNGQDQWYIKKTVL